MNLILAKLFEFFKMKSPKIYGFFVLGAAFVYFANGQNLIHVPAWVIDTIVALGFVSGVKTTEILNK